tara:strand:- start:1929 stop:2324 length:396 start_codon:yes stop_codon:yes gene_type:complete
MPRKPSRKTIVKKLDTIFSKYVRLKDADFKGNCICVTCGKSYYWKEIQAGHFISRKHYSTRWDERNVKPQCYSCNVMRYGEQYKYSKYLGIELSEDLLNLSYKIVKFSNPELIEMTLTYNKLVQELEMSYI